LRKAANITSKVLETQSKTKKIIVLIAKNDIKISIKRCIERLNEEICKGNQSGAGRDPFLLFLITMFCRIFPTMASDKSIKTKPE
jgi:hypothetical protein